MDKKLKYFQVYDDIRTHYEKEMYWQKGLLSDLEKKMKTKRYKEVDHEIAKTLVQMFKNNIKGLKLRLKEVEKVFGE